MKIGCIKSAGKQTIYKLMRLAPKLLNCRVNMNSLLKNIRFFLVILRKTKKKYLENIAFIVIVRLVAHTIQHNSLLQFYL